MGMKSILIIGSIGIVLGFGIKFGNNAARAHVNYMTAVDDHPITCWTCHLYTQQDNILARMQHKTYISPYNLSLSSDGNTLYVIGQESNQVLVVDPHSGQVEDRIDVGLKPHTLALTPDNHTGYVSNQWADDIYQIDLMPLIAFQI